MKDESQQEGSHDDSNNNNKPRSKASVLPRQLASELGQVKAFVTTFERHMRGSGSHAKDLLHSEISVGDHVVVSEDGGLRLAFSAGYAVVHARVCV